MFAGRTTIASNVQDRIRHASTLAGTIGSDLRPTPELDPSVDERVGRSLDSW